MTLRTSLLAPLALIAAPAFAEMIPLANLSAYMNSVTTAETDFTQVNADGTVSLGKIYLRRPGRMRFEYAPPDASLVLTSAGTVAIFDAKSNQPPERYPLSRTPLSLILDDKINLESARMVVAYTEVGNATQVVVQDPNHPEYGNIALMFTANPITLRQWVITDDLGQQTTVILGGLTQGIDYPPTLFSIDVELGNRNP
jgi:outer membrane lipoprotein-sorting protein